MGTRLRLGADQWDRPSVLMTVPDVNNHAPLLMNDGGTLRVVCLGDSIVNDTSRSGWDLLVERRHPTCRIEKITSVRGSTGCWWYKEPGRVKEFVLDHMPDLVVIGGISHRGDAASIREVIRQIRGTLEADILLMTGAFGQINPHKDEQWQAISDPNHYSDYRKHLEALARDVGAAFLDMEAAWGRYIRQSGKDLNWFKRDPIHANERGEQILGPSSRLSCRSRRGRETPQDQESDPSCGEARPVPGLEVRLHDALGHLQPVGLHRVVAAGRGGQVGPAGRLAALDRARQGLRAILPRLRGPQQDLQPAEIRPHEVGGRRQGRGKAPPLYHRGRAGQVSSGRRPAP
jgi:hypothetical protein